MASCLNNYEVSGYLVNEPRFDHTKQTNTPVFNARIKAVEYVKDGDDWREILIGYFDVEMFGESRVSAVPKGLKKGDKVKLLGGLRTKFLKKFDRKTRAYITNGAGEEVKFPKVYIKATSVELEEEAASSGEPQGGGIRRLVQGVKKRLS